MTPLAKLLARYLPPPLRAPALALVYATMIGALLLIGQTGHSDIIYIDVNR